MRHLIIRSTLRALATGVAVGWVLAACSSGGGGSTADGGTTTDAAGTATPDTDAAGTAMQDTAAGDTAAAPDAAVGPDTATATDVTAPQDADTSPPPADVGGGDVAPPPPVDAQQGADAGPGDAGTPDASPPGDATQIPTDTECGQIADCVVNSCNLPPSTACVDACKADKSAEAAEAFDALMQCVMANCATADDQDVCISKFCADEAAACVGTVPMPGSCSSAWYCWLECLPNDTACNDACVTLAGDAQGALEDVLQCLGSECTKPFKASCIAESVRKGGACSDAAATCAPPGDQVCTSVVDCVRENCNPGEVTCQATCFSTGSSDAAVYAAKFVECLERTCKDDATCDDPHGDEWFNTAQTITCGSEWSNCFQQGQ